ncbi:hypothetical protein [Mucilaginibacter antarcticus]|uniref:Uncharacterized protein n=1 Tax=Mucilaginibacter antarcticus TaxID=1855725 RepID=A0ABW5XK28_9SPHI
MKRKISFDPAWVIFFLVTATLVILNFMEDEHSRNLIAGIILCANVILFLGSVLLRTLTDRIG